MNNTKLKLKKTSGTAKKIKAEPFVKWAGGKTQLLNQYKNFFPSPKSYHRYIEPFVGGGAVFFFLQGICKKNAIIADLNEDLINCYESIKTNAEKLMKELEKHEESHSKDYYYEQRKKYNNGLLNKIEKAALFIYLNKMSFNGLHRVNCKGEFNVPLGSNNNKKIFDKKNFQSIGKILSTTNIIAGSYETVLNKTKADDFVYLDPPYYPVEGKGSFTKYTQNPFLGEAHNALSLMVEEIDKKGCKFMLSNSDSKFIRNLYKNPKFQIIPIKAKRYINCLGEDRGKNVDEILVINYEV